MKDLILIPYSYPYSIGKEDTFLSNEITYYKHIFSNITFLPSNCFGDKALTEKNISIDESLSNYKVKQLTFNLFHKPSFLIKELLWVLKHNPTFKNLKKAIRDYLLIIHYLKFFESYFINKKNESVIIYTYWFTPITTAACLYSKKNNQFKVITRAHGIDLFEERNENYIPFRQYSINILEQIFVVSEYGKNYMTERYDNTKLKVKLSPIGIVDFNIKNEKSTHGCFHIVSCSSIDENKRLDLIIKSLSKFSSSNPNIKISWTHFGDGKLKSKIYELIKTIVTKNIIVDFKGQVSNYEILDFYKKNSVDVFITTSASEGGRPVSITEAICCHIPIIATKVGGIPELVTKKNGILLSSNPTIQEITNALNAFVNNTVNVDNMRIASRKIWEEKCNADKLFPELMNQLQAL